jgi:hypothetical protein
MSNKLTFDPGVKLSMEFRRARNGSKKFIFLNSAGAPYPLTDTFEINVKENPWDTANVFQLTLGSGIGISINEMTLSITDVQSDIPEKFYYLEIYNATTKKTWVNAPFEIFSGVREQLDSDTELTVNLDPDVVHVTVNDAGVFTSDLKVAYFDLSAADILALNTTPILVLPAPGANKFYSFVSSVFNYSFGGTPYTRNSSAGIVFSYDQVTSAPMLAIGNILILSNDSVRESLSTGIGDSNLSLYANKAVYLKLNGGSFTFGNGTLRIKAIYHIVDLN